MAAMKLNAELDASRKRGWLALAGLVAVPVYVLPVGIWGLRALRPKLLRTAARGTIALGMLSLVGLSLTGLSRWIPGKVAGGGGPRKMPPLGPLMPEEFAASAASGH